MTSTVLSWVALLQARKQLLPMGTSITSFLGIFYVVKVVQSCLTLFAVVVNNLFNHLFIERLFLTPDSHCFIV